MEVFVEFVCVLSVYGIRVILRGDLTVDKCLNWILVGEMEGFQVISPKTSTRKQLLSKI